MSEKEYSENKLDNMMLACRSLTLAEYYADLVRGMTKWFTAALHETLKDRTTIFEQLRNGPVELSARLRGESIVIQDIASEFALFEALDKVHGKPNYLIVETRIMAVPEEPCKAMLDQLQHQLNAQRVFYKDGYICAEMKLTGAAADEARRAACFSTGYSAEPLSEGSRISGGIAPPPSVSKPKVTVQGQGAPPRPKIPCDLKPLYITEGATNPPHKR